MNVNVEIAGKQVWLEAMTGRVADEKKWNETHIRSSGGGGFVYNGSGFVNPTRISNVNTTRHEFWLVAENGRELCVDLRNSSVQVRPGQVVTMAWGAVQGQKRGPFLLYQNHTTGERQWLQTGNTVLKAMGFAWLVLDNTLLAAAAVLVLGFFVSHLFPNLSFILIAGPIGFLALRYTQLKKAAVAAITENCLQLLSTESSEAGQMLLRTRPA